MKKELLKMMGWRSVKKTAWMSLSLEEKEHISKNLKAIFFETSSSLPKYKNPRFMHYNHNLVVTTENKKFSVWAADKNLVLENLYKFKVKCDLKNPKELLDFARRFPSILFSAGHLLESKSFAIEALRINQKVLPFLNQKLRDNDSVVRAAVATFKTKNRTKLLRFASERLRDNKKFMKEIIQTCPGSFPFLSKRLRKDKDLIDIYKSRTNYITSVEELNGLPIKDRLELLKYKVRNGEFSGVSINWLKRQPKALKGDKELVSIFMIRHHSYHPTLFPKFDDLKEIFRDEDFFFDFIKYYLVSFFLTFKKHLMLDENGYCTHKYNKEACFENWDMPFHVQKKLKSFNVFDFILDCLGEEGLQISKMVDYRAELFAEIARCKETELFNLTTISPTISQKDFLEFQKDIDTFYAFIDQANGNNVLKTAIAAKNLNISSKELNQIESTQRLPKNNPRLDSWFPVPRRVLSLEESWKEKMVRETNPNITPDDIPF